MDDYSPFNQTKTRNPFARPYPPPPKPKSQPTDVDAGWAPGTGPPRLSDVASRPNTLKADAAKRDAVVDAFRYAWSANEKDAFSDDEYHPISHRGSNLGSGAGIGYTVVDALDTMLLMGLESEYTRARTWVQEKLSFERPGYFSTFQVSRAFNSAERAAVMACASRIVGQSVPLAQADEFEDRVAMRRNGSPRGFG